VPVVRLAPMANQRRRQSLPFFFVSFAFSARTSTLLLMLLILVTMPLSPSSP